MLVPMNLESKPKYFSSCRLEPGWFQIDIKSINFSILSLNFMKVYPVIILMNTNHIALGVLEYIFGLHFLVFCENYPFTMKEKAT